MLAAPAHSLKLVSYTPPRSPFPPTPVTSALSLTPVAGGKLCERRRDRPDDDDAGEGGKGGAIGVCAGLPSTRQSRAACVREVGVRACAESSAGDDDGEEVA